MPPPAKRVKATTYRRDSPEVAKLWLRLVFMQLTRDLFAIAKFLSYFIQSLSIETQNNAYSDDAAVIGSFDVVFRHL